MEKWEIQLDEYDALLKSLMDDQEKGVSELRFNRPFIPASDISAQYFCEKKVEMEYLHGEVETEEKTMGAEAHEQLLVDAVKIKREELWQKIYGRKPVFAPEMLLFAKYKDVVLAGRPDSVMFYKGFPVILFEYKFSKSGRAYNSHHVQAGVYGILLSKMGFNTSKLFYAINIVDPKARNDRELKHKVIDTIMKHKPQEITLEIDNARIFMHKFNEGEAERDLDWAIEYWKKIRNAIPTSNMNKCKNCVYKVECTRSTHKDLTSF